MLYTEKGKVKFILKYIIYVNFNIVGVLNIFHF